MGSSSAQDVQLFWNIWTEESKGIAWCQEHGVEDYTRATTTHNCVIFNSLLLTLCKAFRFMGPEVPGMLNILLVVNLLDRSQHRATLPPLPAGVPPPIQQNLSGLLLPPDLVARLPDTP